VAVPDFDNPKLRQFHDYWRSKIRSGRRFPARADIDPVEIPRLLPSILLIDVVRDFDSVRFRLRLVGTEYVRRIGRDHTGRWLEDGRPVSEAEAIIATYKQVLATGEPHFWRSRLHDPERQHVVYERLACPLADDGETIDVLVAMFDFDAT